MSGTLFQSWRDSPEFEAAFLAWLTADDPTRRPTYVWRYANSAEPADFAAWLKARDDREHPKKRWGGP